MGFDWNPLKWVETGYDWSEHEVVGAVTFTGTSIGKLAGWTVHEAESLPSGVFKFVTAGLRALGQVMWHALGLVHTTLVKVNHALEARVPLINRAESWINHSATTIAGYVDRGTTLLWHDVVYPAVSHLANDARSWAADAETYAVGVGRELDHLASTTVSDLVHDFQAVPGLIHSGAVAVWHTGYTDVIAPIEHDVASVVQVAAGSAEWIATHGPSLIRLVLGAADWLILFGEYAVSDIEHLPDFLGSVSDPRKVAAQAIAIEPNVEHVVGQLLDYLERVA